MCRIFKNKEKFTFYFDIICKLFTVSAIIIGGSWAYFRFNIERVNKWNILLTVRPEVKQYSDSLSLLNINVDIRNVGKIVVATDSILLNLIAMPDKIKRYEIIEPKKGDTIINEMNIIKRYEGIYRIEPATEYHEIESILVPRGKIYVIKATFLYKNEGISEFRIIFIK